MKKLLVTMFTLGLFASVANAKGNANFSRGGYGFLFPDANSFNNGGQMAETTGTALEANYTRSNQTEYQTLSPSIVWGSGRFGLGAYASRTATSLFKADAAHSDTAGAGLGLSLASGRITIGGTIARSIDVDQTNDGVVNAAINYNGVKGSGFHAGAGFGTTLNSDSGTETRTATLAMGWGFNGVANFEVDYTFKDLDNTDNNYEAGGYLNLHGSNYYLATGYSYDKPSEQSSVVGRLGFVMGALDMSVHASKALVTGQDPNYGASLRAAF